MQIYKKTDMDTKTLGKKLKFYRERLGVSLYRISVNSGLRIDTAKKIEAGQVTTTESFLLYLSGLGIHMELFPNLPSEFAGTDLNFEFSEEKARAIAYWNKEFDNQ